MALLSAGRYESQNRADQPFRITARDLRQYCVRSGTNTLVPLANIVSLKETSGPQVINHYNLFRSAEIDGAAAPGYSSSQGLQAMEDLANQNMLQGMSFNWPGWRSRK
jgi:HAE1 family hydrophobic/amphiphilic exporter-1